MRGAENLRAITEPLARFSATHNYRRGPGA